VCGSFFGALRAWCPCICCCCPKPFVNIETSLAGLLENFGRYKKILEPGLHQINPWTESIKVIDLKTRIFDLNR